MWPLLFGRMALLSGIIASLVSYATYNLKGNFYTLVEEAKEKYVKHHPHDSLKTFWILASHKEVQKRDDPELHGHKE